MEKQAVRSEALMPQATTERVAGEPSPGGSRPVARGYSPALFPQLAPQQAAQEHEAGPKQRYRSGLWRNVFRVVALVVAGGSAQKATGRYSIVNFREPMSVPD